MKKWFIIGTLVVLIGCSNEKLPENIISEDEMAGVLIDIYIAEGRLNNRSSSKYLPRDIYPVYHEIILERRQMADSTYKRNMEYYLSHPQALDRVYDIILDSLKLWQAEQNVELPEAE